MTRSAVVALAIVGLAAAACGPSDAPLGAAQVPPDCTLIGATVSPASATLHPGDTLRARATGGSCTGTVVRFRWTSSDSTIAMVNADAGLIRALRSGSATITASQVDDPTVKGAMVVLVSP